MRPAKHLLEGALAAAFALALFSPHVLAAEDADTREALAYRFTESNFAQYKLATEKLSALPDACTDDDESDAASLDDMVAQLEAMPGARAAIQSAGMSMREYAVFSVSLVHHSLGAWAASQEGGKLPPGMSQANVDFLKQHEAAIRALGELADCEDPDDLE